ncbi:hypothetical protein GCM10011360_04670 [Primorskyibacter flagellatus]|uniref:Uncharacterized protein n=1 Tax=Primorskyibacter flagellatus TaxID=1387277 RepID=A0A916ZZH8_9RHOB|nr:hypothetical protein [Primorskyibacter flagellatus]GGE18940.1 hypothetical protein GCM10011360_04670 [Primorskyibacter flagellatus]
MRVDRGASAVGQLDLLPESEAWWVRALRLWCDGEGGQAVLRDDLRHRFGEQGAATVFARFTDLLSLIFHHARRPLMRHGVACTCVGADEAVFALFCSQAVQDREEAMMIACLMLRADVAPIAVSLAQTLGLDLQRAAPVAPTMVAARRRLN